MDGMSLLDVLRGVMLDPAEQTAYNADPHAYLEQYGYDDVDPADLSEAFGLVADTLPPDQAQAAWSAATEPDDSTFGTVTQDFDGDPGIDAPDDIGPEGTGTDDAGLDDIDSDDPGLDLPEVEIPDVEIPDVDLSDGAGSALSFGEGDGMADMDDPTFGDAAGAEATVGGADDDGGIAGLSSIDDDADSAFDDGFDGGGFDSGFDDDLSDGIGESADHGGDVEHRPALRGGQLGVGQRHEGMAQPLGEIDRLAVYRVEQHGVPLAEGR